MRNGWQETHSRTVPLPDDVPEYFEVFARFIYTGKIFSCVVGDKVAEDEDNEWGRLAMCWVLGDKLSSNTFKDAICDAWCEKMRMTDRHPIELHQTIYPSTAAASPARRLVVDITVWKWTTVRLGDRKMDESWNEFFKDVAVRLHSLSEQEHEGDAPFNDPGCNYHEHVAAKTACYKTMF